MRLQLVKFTVFTAAHHRFLSGLTHITQVYILKFYFSKIRFNIIMPYTTSLQNSLFASGLSTKIVYVFLISPCVLHAQLK